MAAYRLPLHRRLAARFVTGPAGHFVAGLADWVTLLARMLYARARGRRLG